MKDLTKKLKFVRIPKRKVSPPRFTAGAIECCADRLSFGHVLKNPADRTPTNGTYRLLRAGHCRTEMHHVSSKR